MAGQITEGSIEQEIQNKGLNAPRLTPAHIDAQIVGESYYVFPGTTLTVCAPSAGTLAVRSTKFTSVVTPVVLGSSP